MTQVIEMNQLKEVHVGVGSSSTLQINPWKLALVEKIVLGVLLGPMQETAFLKEGNSENVASMESALVGTDLKTLKQFIFMKIFFQTLYTIIQSRHHILYWLFISLCFGEWTQKPKKLLFA